MEARIAVPESTKKEVMKVVACGLFSYIYSLNGDTMPKQFRDALKRVQGEYGAFKVYHLDDGQPITATVQFDPKELPASYTKGLRLQASYPIKVRVGDFAQDEDNAMAYYSNMGNGRSGAITVNLSMLPEIDSIGSVEGVETTLHDIEGIVAHELQHATQDVVLRKKHASQMETLPNDVGDDEYYSSQIEFQPQITTAANRFSKVLNHVRSQVDVDNKTATALMRAYVDPNGQMPQGFLKFKKFFNNDFFNSLYRNDKKKWQKAVKDFHGLLSKA